MNYTELPKKYKRAAPGHGAIPAVYISMIGRDNKFEGKGVGGTRGNALGSFLWGGGGASLDRLQQYSTTTQYLNTMENPKKLSLFIHKLKCTHSLGVKQNHYAPELT